MNKSQKTFSVYGKTPKGNRVLIDSGLTAEEVKKFADRGYQIEAEKIKLAEYEVERLPIYSVTRGGKYQVKTLTVWQDTEPSVITGQKFFWVQIGNGKLHACKAAKNHADRAEFIFSNQRWAKR